MSRVRQSFAKSAFSGSVHIIELHEGKDAFIEVSYRDRYHGDLMSQGFVQCPA